MATSDDQLKQWEEDFLLSSGSWVIIERPRKGKVSFTQHGDIRLELEHRTNKLEEAIRGQLQQELGELRREIEDLRLPPKDAVDQFEYRAKQLEMRSAERSSASVDKLLVKFEADRVADADPETNSPYDAPLSSQERKKLRDRYSPVCKEVCRVAKMDLKSSLLSGYAGQRDRVRAARREVIGNQDKGNLDSLRGPDGKIQEAVTYNTAMRYLGIGRRAVEKAVKNGTTLKTIGHGQNKKITVASLKAYVPPTTPPTTTK